MLTFNVEHYQMEQYIYNILCFIVIPFVCNIYFYKTRPKKIWLSVVTILIMTMVVSAIFYPYVFTDIIKSEYDFTTIYWLLFYPLMHLVVAVLFTGVTYIFIKLRKKNSR